MPTITLPDGNNLSFSKKITGLEVAEKISKSLAKQAMVISIDGELKDLDYIIDKDCSIKIFTSKMTKGLKQSDMIQLIFWQWQSKNYSQVHKLLLDQL